MGRTTGAKAKTPQWRIVCQYNLGHGIQNITILDEVFPSITAMSEALSIPYHHIRKYKNNPQQQNYLTPFIEVSKIDLPEIVGTHTHLPPHLIKSLGVTT